MKKIVPLVVLVFCTLHTFSQVKIKGIVTDSLQNNTIPLVTVNLFNQSNLNKALKTTYSDKEGKFVLLADTGKHVIVLTHMGYAKTVIPVTIYADQDINLQQINMTAAASQLGNVTVTAKRPLIEQSNDKITFNVEDDPAAKTENATDILKKTPFVSVDGEGNVQLNGQGNFKILLNGKETAMFARNPKEALRGFPSSLIVKIEVITAPSAKYDAEGVGGIINIITKKKIVGYNGSISSYYSSINNYSESINGNLKTGKIGITGFYSLSGNSPQKNKSISETVAFDPTVFASRRLDGVRQRKSFYNTGNLEVTYEMDSLNTLVGYGNISGGRSKVLFQQQIITTYASSPSTNSSLNQDIASLFPSSGIGADYTHKFAHKPEQELSIRFNGQLSKNEDINTSVQDNPGQDRFVLNNSKSHNQEYTVQVDFIKPVNAKQRLETGAKMITRRADSDFESLLKYAQAEEYKFNPSNTDKFQYHQEVYSGYSSYNLSLKKYSIRLGLRLEQTAINGDFETAKTKVKQNYTNLIPNIQVTRKMSSSLTTVLSYNQRLQRPYITNLNPFVTNNDSLNISYGNPNLGPQVIHNLTWQNRISKGKMFAGISLFGSYSDNLISQFVEYNKTTGVTSTTSGNVGKEMQFSVSYYVNAPVSQKLTINMSGVGRYNKTENTFNKLQQVESFSGGAYGGFMYKVTSKFTFSGSGGITRMPTTLISVNKPLWFHQFNFGYKFFGDKLSTTVNFNNMDSKFFKYRSTTESLAFRTDNTNLNLYRVIYFGATWRFGKLKEAASKKKGISNDDLIGG